MFGGGVRGMDENTRVKDCPCRRIYTESVRHYGSEKVVACVFPEGNSGRTDTNKDWHFSCKHHGNSKLVGCPTYNEWSLKQVRDAFKKLEKIEAHRDAVLGVLRM